MIHGSHSEKIPHSSPAAVGTAPPFSGFVQRPWQFPPETLARHLAHLPGLIWLDSAQTGPGAVSLLSAAPLEILTGTLDHDWHRVESLLQRHAQPYHPDWPLPSGGLFGWVGYDRHFTFGHYPHALLYVHDTATWFESGHLSDQFSPAPHAAYLDLNGTQVLSASPELFLRLSDRRIITRPIKGTRPRFPHDPARDTAARADLLASAKERAELLMITDLQRNDLGQVCAYGSVQVPELWKIEAYPQVFHLVSTVEGQLPATVSHSAAFRACFPGGSITGAPKKRATEIIAELEPHPRGLYTGAIGGFGFNGESLFNIAIRTAIRQNNTIHFHTGAGIVADSDPDLEYQETQHKAAGLLLMGQP
jgi:hypothetical protein